MAELTVRPATTLLDAQAIGVLLMAEHAEYGPAPLDVKLAFIEVCRVCDLGAAFLVEKDGDPVATMGLQECRWFFSRDTFLDAMWFYALPAHRDGEAYRLLLEQARWLAEETGKIVYVTVRGQRPNRRKSTVQIEGERLRFAPAGLVLRMENKDG